MKRPSEVTAKALRPSFDKHLDFSTLPEHRRLYEGKKNLNNDDPERLCTMSPIPHCNHGHQVISISRQKMKNNILTFTCTAFFDVFIIADGVALMD
mmetsp:Transcript_38473/g.93076  ORF Transcript_38473/g.93076 Transcript_38473/m.93076 type:complete len:96 (+) Transcript_38473:122-409(+)